MSLRSAKYLSGRVFVLGLKGNGFETHRKHCIVSLSMTNDHLRTG